LTPGSVTNFQFLEFQRINNATTYVLLTNGICFLLTFNVIKFVGSIDLFIWTELFEEDASLVFSEY
jgi:hypothetical protein